MSASSIAPEKNEIRKTEVTIDGRAYPLRVRRAVTQPSDAPRLLVVAYQPNDSARRIVETCIKTIQRLTEEPHELWIIDNNSPDRRGEWLLDYPGVNAVLSRTEPVPPEGRGWLKKLGGRQSQENWGSYANAIGLEIGERMIDPDSRYLMTLHMDVMPTHPQWLTYLKSKIDTPDNQGKTAAAGVRMDTTRVPEGILHVLGYMVDYALFKRLKLDFMHDLPRYDVGDRVTVRLREAGYDVFACPNSLWRPELVETLPPDSIFRDFYADRAFDEQGNVIFMHMGRGIPKSSGQHVKGTLPQEWTAFAHDHLLR